MKVRAKANGDIIDLPPDHPLIGKLYDPVEEPVAELAAAADPEELDARPTSRRPKR